MHPAMRYLRQRDRLATPARVIWAYDGSGRRIYGNRHSILPGATEVLVEVPQHQATHSVSIAEALRLREVGALPPEPWFGLDPVRDSAAILARQGGE